MAQASELEVIAGGGIAVPFKEVAAQFERSSAHRIRVHFGTAPELIKMATSGVPFDLGVVPRDVMQDAAARAQFAAGPVSEIARVGIAVAVRTGAPKPDIGTPQALKQTLIEAGCIASIPASATGAQLCQIYEELGIADAMLAKTRAQPSPAGIIEAVASGEADLAVFTMNVLTDPRLDIVGPFPREIQREVVYVAGIGTASKDVTVAHAFIAHLRSPTGSEVFKAKGLTPG